MNTTPRDENVPLAEPEAAAGGNERRCIYCSGPMDPPAEFPNYAEPIRMRWLADEAAAALAGFCSSDCQRVHAADVVYRGAAWWQKKRSVMDEAMLVMSLRMLCGSLQIIRRHLVERKFDHARHDLARLVRISDELHEAIANETWPSADLGKVIADWCKGLVECKKALDNGDVADVEQLVKESIGSQIETLVRVRGELGDPTAPVLVAAAGKR